MPELHSKHNDSEGNELNTSMQDSRTAARINLDEARFDGVLLPGANSRKTLGAMIDRGFQNDSDPGWPHYDLRMFYKYREAKPLLSVNTDWFVGENSAGSRIINDYIEGFPLMRASNALVQNCVFLGDRAATRLTHSTLRDSTLRGVHVLSEGHHLEIIGCAIHGEWALGELRDSVLIKTSVRSEALESVHDCIFVNCSLEGMDSRFDRHAFCAQNAVYADVPEKIVAKLPLCEPEKFEKLLAEYRQR